MRDRPEQLLRLLILILAVIVAGEFLRAGCRANPFARLNLPPIPTLQTNAVASAAAPKTNPPPGDKSAPPNSAGANSLPSTNHTANSTNLETTSPTNHESTVPTTNAPAAATNHAAGATTTNTTNRTATATNSPPTNAVANTTNAPAETNAIATDTNAPAHTNVIATATTNTPATNHLTLSDTNHPGTNLAQASPHPGPPPGGPMMPGGPMPGPFPGLPGLGGPAAPLPKDIQARVDKIVNSEIFAPVMHPEPMQLFGIAGDTILLRTDSGQSGLLKEGESLGNVKLLRIGINRVLVEENGEKKELTIFDGYGGESLMPKSN